MITPQVAAGYVAGVCTGLFIAFMLLVILLKQPKGWKIYKND